MTQTTNPLLECGDLSPLWSVATCRNLRSVESSLDCGVKPPRTKAVTGHRTPKEVLSWTSRSRCLEAGPRVSLSPEQIVSFTRKR